MKIPIKSLLGLRWYIPALRGFHLARRDAKDGVEPTVLEDAREEDDDSEQSPEAPRVDARRDDDDPERDAHRTIRCPDVALEFHMVTING